MGITAEQLEEIAFASLRNVFECAAVMVRFGGAASAEYEALISGQSLGTIIGEVSANPNERGIIYVRKSNYPGLAADEDFEVQLDGTWHKVRAITVGYKGRSITSIEFQQEMGKNSR